jgi:2'-5' RNA ligase
VPENLLRLFVALDLDAEARKAIAALQQSIARTLEGSGSIKPVDPAHIHLTLAFLGEIAAAAVPAVVGTLSEYVDVRQFAAAFRGLGVFPPRGAPRVLWLGVEEGAEKIVEVQREVASRIDRLGIALERRPFHPHLTLARWKTSKTSRPADRQPAFSSEAHNRVIRVNIDHATLYQSRLSPAGPTYTALTRANLT